MISSELQLGLVQWDFMKRLSVNGFRYHCHYLLHHTGLSEGTHTSNPASQPEDSTAWDSFQVSRGRRHFDPQCFLTPLWFSIWLSAPVFWQHRCRHPSSTQSPPESRPPHPLSAPVVWLHPRELSPGRAGPAGKDSAAAVAAPRGLAGQMVMNSINTM